MIWSMKQAWVDDMFLFLPKAMGIVYNGDWRCSDEAGA